MNDEGNQQNNGNEDLVPTSDEHATVKNALASYKSRGKNKVSSQTYENSVKDSLITRQRNPEKIQKSEYRNPSVYGASLENSEVSLQQPEKRKRVDTASAGLMIITALIFDAIQFALDFIPIVGWILSSLVGVFAWLTFYTWTAIKGWKVSSVQKQFMNDVVLPFVDLIPIINALPMQTIKVVRLILLIKAEDTLYNSTKGKLDIENASQTLGKAAKLGKVA